jgi:hypothetical protein
MDVLFSPLEGILEDLEVEDYPLKVSSVPIPAVHMFPVS